MAGSRCLKSIAVTIVIVSLLGNAVTLLFLANSRYGWVERGHVYYERDTSAGVALAFNTRVVEHVETPFQSVEVHDSRFFGKILVIDDDLMLTQRDEASYHEMAAHVPLAYIPNAKTVVIIGGGDGGVCAQVLRHPNVERVVMVEIDPAVVEVSRRHFPKFEVCFTDPRVTLLHQDGAVWAQKQAQAAGALKGRVDVVIVDSTDFNQAESLFTVRFYKNLKALLVPRRGIVVHNLSSLSWNLRGCVSAIRRQRRVFDTVVPYQVFQPTYMSGHYGYLFCSDGVDPLHASVDWPAFIKKAIPTSYYTPAVHWASFALPGSVADVMQPRGWAHSLRMQEDAQHASSLPRVYPLNGVAAADGGEVSKPGDTREGTCGCNDVHIVEDGDGALPPLGRHFLVELGGVAPDLLNDEGALSQVLLEAATAGNLTVLSHSFHSFSPHGVTGILLLAESHLSIHTWPEHAYAAVDVFTCATTESPSLPQVALDHLTAALGPAVSEMSLVARGMGRFVESSCAAHHECRASELPGSTWGAATVGPDATIGQPSAETVRGVA